MLGSTGESQNHIEENTHIAYLCDLLERIWGHGLKKREVCVCVCALFPLCTCVYWKRGWGGWQAPLAGILKCTTVVIDRIKIYNGTYTVCTCMCGLLDSWDL